MTDRFRTSFPLRFAAILGILGIVGAGVVPIYALLDRGSQNSRSETVGRARDKAELAYNLVAVQRQSVALSAMVLAQEVAAPGVALSGSRIETILAEIPANQRADEVVADIDRIAPIWHRVGSSLPSTTDAAHRFEVAADSGAHPVSDVDGKPWLVVQAPIGAGVGRTIVARPLSAELVDIVRRDVGTDLVLVRGEGVAVAGSVAGRPVGAGQILDGALSGLATVPQQPAVVGLDGHDFAVASRPLSAGFSVIVAIPLGGGSTSMIVLAVFAALLVVTVLVVEFMVQRVVRRPFRRLDRAVALSVAGNFAQPLPIETGDDVGRLGAAFETMRRHLSTTLQTTRAHTAIAHELSAAQSLRLALDHVCRELRSVTAAGAALIVVGGSDVNDGFVVACGVEGSLDANALLQNHGPVGAAFRRQHPGAVEDHAEPGSAEAGGGLRDMCLAPLTTGNRNLGVVCLSGTSDGPLPPEARNDLMATAAEQVALTLERHHFLILAQRQGSIDDLTGLFNHRFIVDYLGHHVALSERLDQPLAVLILDLDHFKTLNDASGHPAGDRALQAFGHMLNDSLRPTDIAGRYGGEEFLVVMPNTTTLEACRMAEEIRETAVAVGDNLGTNAPSTVTVSIGVAAFPENTKVGDQLLHVADAALHRAKVAGRNRVCPATGTRAR